MTNWGGKIPETTIADLQTTLEEIDDDGKAVKRLVVALAYKHGRTPAEIEDTFGFAEKTVYEWLDRIEDGGLEEAVSDESKPGRPSKLTDDQFDKLTTVLDQSPADVGYDVQAWSPDVVQDWLNTEFEIEYTRRHIRRLLRDAGFSW